LQGEAPAARVSIVKWVFKALSKSKLTSIFCKLTRVKNFTVSAGFPFSGAELGIPLIFRAHPSHGFGAEGAGFVQSRFMSCLRA
jgi:hypothetical protein